MKKILNITLIIALLFISLGCERMFMDPQPETDSESILHEYYKVVKEKYGMFEFKKERWGLDWEQEYREASTFLAKNPTDEYTFKRSIATMVRSLHDAHSWIVFPDGSGAGYDPSFIRVDTINGDSLVPIFKPYCFDTTEEVLKNYLTLKNLGEGVDYGVVTTGNVGYLRYRSFMDEITDDMMNRIISEFKTSKVNGMIVDVRGNGGGDPSMASMMASHFTKEVKYAGYERFKTGPKADDFADSKMYTKVSDGEIFDKKVVILTDVGCFSATTTLIYLSCPNDNVTLIGDTIGGGAGSTFDNELADGTVFSISTSEFIVIDKNGVEQHIDNGYRPDIVVIDTLFSDGDDAIIDSAIAFINR